MKKFAKAAIITAAGIITLTASLALAAGNGNTYAPSGAQAIASQAQQAVDRAPSLGATAPDEERQPAYCAFTGRIIELNPYYENDAPVEGKWFVLVEDGDGGLFNFLVDDATVRVTGNDLAEGASFKGFYEANRPMLMIYPPQTHADVAAVDLPDFLSVKVDRFGADLVSQDGTLKLIPGEQTSIALEDGAAIAADEIGNRALVVVYGVSTRSIPAQTVPDTIIVLYEKAAAAAGPADIPSVQ